MIRSSITQVSRDDAIVISSSIRADGSEEIYNTTEIKKTEFPNAFTDFKSLELEVCTFCLVTGRVSTISTAHILSCIDGTINTTKNLGEFEKQKKKTILDAMEHVVPHKFPAPSAADNTEKFVLGELITASIKALPPLRPSP